MTVVYFVIILKIHWEIIGQSGQWIINSTLNSQYLKTFFKFVFDSFDKVVKLYTHIDMDDSDITKVMIRIPATENDEEVIKNF